MLFADDLGQWYAQNQAFVAGLDEAGRGPLAGPVVAAAVVLDSTFPISNLNDSKKLSEKKREQLFQPIYDQALAVGVAVVSPKRIDEINILNASLEAMKLAFEEAEKIYGKRLIGALVDGNQRAPLSKNVRQWTVIKGDSLWPAIMAASIVAKVHRDRLMLAACEQYPGYGFEQHKGYGTASHLKALQEKGPCPIHRRSFAPVNTYAAL